MLLGYEVVPSVVANKHEPTLNGLEGSLFLVASLWAVGHFIVMLHEGTLSCPSISETIIVQVQNQGGIDCFDQVLINKY